MPENSRQRAAEKNVPGDPIYITRSPDGRLMIASRDAQALDTLERLATRMGTSRKDYAVFYLKYNTAASVRYNLALFFANDGSGDFRRSAYGDSSSDGNTARPGLSQRMPLRFIEDMQTNSILVQRASADQLRLIEDLIAMYDRPEQPNAKTSRMIKIFSIVHSRASVIAETIKDIYRDLLSSNDKAFEAANQGQNQSRGQGAAFLDTSENEGRISQSRFKGQLSLGIDETSNRLLVSCPESLMRNIVKIVEDLDRGAAPVEQTFQMLCIDRSIDAGMLQKKLMDMLKKPLPQTEQPQHPNQPAQQDQPRQQQRGSGGGGGGGQRQQAAPPTGDGQSSG